MKEKPIKVEVHASIRITLGMILGVLIYIAVHI